VDQGRTSLGLYAEDQWTLSPRVTLTAGARFDHLSDQGGTFNPRLAIVAQGGSGFSGKLLYGRAFRAPTFRELAFDLPGGTGNPELGLVKADEIAAGVMWQRGRLRLEAHPFLSLVRDAVALPGLPAPGRPGVFANGPGLRSLGLELVGTSGFGVNNSWFFGLTLQDPEDRESGERAAGVATALLAGGASFEVWGRAVVTPTVVARSSRARGQGDVRSDTPGYLVASVTARTKTPLWRTLDASISVHNLFGTSYADPSVANGVPGDYPRPGRRVLLHVRYKF
jgi:iron complex outermembrane receptor protein